MPEGSERDIPIEGWDHFISCVSALDVGTAFAAPYVFRGQADATWGLEPSILRVVTSEIPLSAGKLIEIEENAMAQFQRHAHLFLPETLIRETTDRAGWLTLMRHHYAPTRLLDWTASPHVAAYFAVEDLTQTDAAIWVVHSHNLIEAMTAKYGDTYLASIKKDVEWRRPDAAPTLYVVGRHRSTDRMAAQQGLFSVSLQIGADHRSILEETMSESDDPPQFLRYIIPAAVKLNFMSRLRLLNVTAASLFPGVDGLGRSVAELTAVAIREELG